MKNAVDNCADDAEALACAERIAANELLKGDKSGHAFRGNQWAAGDTAEFNGKSPDGAVNGRFAVTVVDPHSNASAVTHTDAKSGRQYEHANVHIPQLKVRTERGTEFTAGRHQLSNKGAAFKDKRTTKMDEPSDLDKGDKPGHPYRGNQHSSGEGSGETSHGAKPTVEQAREAGTAAHSKSLQAEASGGGHKAQAHEEAAVAHRHAAEVGFQLGNRALYGYHQQRADYHDRKANAAKAR